MSKFKKTLEDAVLRDCMLFQLQGGQFGVEIEVEGQPLPAYIPAWEVHKEGSLRGHAAEYVTKGAVTRRGLEGSLELLENAFKLNQVKWKDSYRAGIHIHYNVQQRTLLSILHSIIRWTVIEPVFMKLMGKNRDGNLFCISQYDCGDAAMWFQKLCGSKNINGFLRNMPRGKYAGLNTDPVTKFGTLEGRCFPGTLDKNKILLWADMMDAILKHSDVGPLEEFDKANLNPEEYLNGIFGHLPVDLPDSAISLVGFGLEQALPMINTYEEELG